MAFGGEEAMTIRRLADEMTVRYADRPEVRYAAAETAIRSILSYEPETQGELMHAARLVSLSMTQFDLLHEVAQPTASVAEKIRLASEAMRLERTICQSEKLLLQRQAARKAAQPAPPPNEPARAVAPTAAETPTPKQGPAAGPLRPPSPAAAPVRPASSVMPPSPTAGGSSSTPAPVRPSTSVFGDAPGGISAVMREELAWAMARQQAAAVPNGTALDP